MSARGRYLSFLSQTGTERTRAYLREALGAPMGASVRPMITNLAISNFKSLARIPAEERKLLPVGPLNVLIGPNGSGKSRANTTTSSSFSLESTSVSAGNA